ncbi:hypothetical protein NIES2135_21110 [Leptolyngbya boryana NIES-2135]|jgi:hypothetical protein|uniref:Uncharacterized protein n=1 Tax=Leptolyngbya boryana NIES-2135 TaxID=1973484 RepID=A0A1Z4JF44_LEPBY|nr:MULTISPECIES: hypothetical protein [Leptolyngbya]BAY55288.1 hypothetical protein NIES2135_21110 [Leptolyngbya boryana NIES-2135]MBD2369372.1 hypothetical protein [Leptolyngbya sp. FACHB-161]MBD2375626.1 hypothetical protein [Leptolyngbya sp. FACHB-238]MBD2401701.1 hypothetical protein [Leptolyngbya sp. FACHB-239]MBD2406560.1 hypothetical protein [Leptolyngbya sp. FACHB-402]
MIRSKGKIAIALTLSLSAVTFQPREARSNPALVAPAACATGVGCVLVGVAVVGGLAYYVWQGNNPKSQRHYDRIEDPEEEARYLGGPHETEPVIAGTIKDARRKCEQLARGRRIKEVRWFQGNRWDCVFYTGGQNER